MSEVLSMNSAKPARYVINKHGEPVWRCGWGTHDGRGCQETLGTIGIETRRESGTTYL
jgi:hypothetical protein